eukprot:TRINITY_DN10090_c0_g1_i2.p2 TRINITY_DN10090_c0_g1~~TRINITY_DN10090_c0_g1_i2.p2  ORF type:complete len:170 (+),score=3.66 TRINITY_DN10090_c0_g1_i2:293-802(+)
MTWLFAASWPGRKRRHRLLTRGGGCFPGSLSGAKHISTVPFLYRHVHKWHHLSRNPDPWSGLSFHPVEAAIYLSSMWAALAIPQWWSPAVHTGFRWGLLLFPLVTHHGYDDGTMARFHHAHHTLTNYNYGGWPAWDWLCGTLAPEEKSLACRRRGEALRLPSEGPRRGV